jgi:hypothetical protein
MRRALYRTAWLLILCVLVLVLGSTPTVATAADWAHPITPAVAASDPACTDHTAITNDPIAWRSLLDAAVPQHDCAAPPRTVLVRADQIAQRGTAGSAVVNVDRPAQIAGAAERATD